jgi:hypothetical protein
MRNRDHMLRPMSAKPFGRSQRATEEHSSARLGVRFSDEEEDVLDLIQSDDLDDDDDGNYDFEAEALAAQRRLIQHESRISAAGSSPGLLGGLPARRLGSSQKSPVYSKVTGHEIQTDIGASESLSTTVSAQ